MTCIAVGFHTWTIPDCRHNTCGRKRPHATGQNLRIDLAGMCKPAMKKMHWLDCRTTGIHTGVHLASGKISSDQCTITSHGPGCKGPDLAQIKCTQWCFQHTSPATLLIEPARYFLHTMRLEGVKLRERQLPPSYLHNQILTFCLKSSVYPTPQRHGSQRWIETKVFLSHLHSHTTTSFRNHVL